MNNIDKQKERASNTEELLDHLIEIIENNDSRFSLENCASHSRYFSDELDAQFF